MGLDYYRCCWITTDIILSIAIFMGFLLGGLSFLGCGKDVRLYWFSVCAICGASVLSIVWIFLIVARLKYWPNRRIYAEL